MTSALAKQHMDEAVGWLHRAEEYGEAADATIAALTGIGFALLGMVAAQIDHTEVIRRGNRTQVK